MMKVFVDIGSKAAKRVKIKVSTSSLEGTCSGGRCGCAARRCCCRGPEGNTIGSKLLVAGLTATAAGLLMVAGRIGEHVITDAATEKAREIRKGPSVSHEEENGRKKSK